MAATDGALPEDDLPGDFELEAHTTDADLDSLRARLTAARLPEAETV
jgi:hypothetical protein